MWMRASAPGPRPNIAADTEIAPAGYRLPRATMVACKQKRATTSLKAGAGQAAAHHYEVPAFFDFAAARFSALRALTGRSMSERSGLRARSEFCDRPLNRKTQGRRCGSIDLRV
jgi:hypothetical protein